MLDFFGRLPKEMQPPRFCGTRTEPPPPNTPFSPLPADAGPPSSVWTLCYKYVTKAGKPLKCRRKTCILSMRKAQWGRIAPRDRYGTG